MTWGVGLQKPALFLYPSVMEKIDWNAAKEQYITGSDSYAKLAAQFGVHINVFKERGAREGWVKLRKEFRAKTVHKACQIASRTQAKELAKIYEASNILDGIMVTLLNELATSGLDTIMGNGTPGRELESISKALLNNDELKRRLHGILLPREEERLKLDREKFEMEKKKLEMEHSSDKALKVELVGELEEMAK